MLRSKLTRSKPHSNIQRRVENSITPSSNRTVEAKTSAAPFNFGTTPLFTPEGNASSIKGKMSEKALMASANVNAVSLLQASRPRLRSVLELVSNDEFTAKAGAEEWATYRAIKKWLKVDFLKDKDKFMWALDVAGALISKNANDIHPKQVRREKGHQYCKTKGGGEAYATAIVGDSNQIINYCEPFFKKGPQCQRNVTIHERFHLVGIGHGEDAKGNETKQKNRTTSQALNSADDMTDLVKEVLGEKIWVCSKDL